MAKGDRQPQEKGKVKFRFVEFELEGLNSTIEESIKSIVESMSRTSTLSNRIPTIKSTSQSVLPLVDGNEHVEPAPEQEETIQTEPSSDDEDSGSGGSPKGPRRYTVPVFLADVDLDSGEMPFKKYAEQLAPKSDSRKYLVIASWFKKYRKLDSISTDHIYTCNQKMAWKTQKDVGQPFRNQKRKSYFDPAGRNQWAITHIGLDQLNTAEDEQA